MLDNWLNSGTVWFLLGVVLLLVELVTPGVLAVFFAAGAWVAAVGLWLGLIPGPLAAMVVFLVVSVASLLLLRRRFVPVTRRAEAIDSDTDRALEDFAGHTAVVVETIDPARRLGKVEFRGTLWTAEADKEIVAGTPVMITGHSNLTLNVQPVKE